MMLLYLVGFFITRLLKHVQAYTQELEQEVANLQKENARLRRQQEKVRKTRKDVFVLISVSLFGIWLPALPLKNTYPRTD